ncbi:MAG: DUF4339 domain-containing protein [Muribaculaceae bacterium]|nr:DUF4339 domain-containing protein [Muribaculaceae bacterium]
MKQFFIIQNNQNFGPLPADQLKLYGLGPNSLVWCEGMANWTPASQVPELAQFLAPAAPVPPATPAPPAAPVPPAAPAQPQYSQPYQQPAQQPYQQPAQQPYQQPYQQPGQPAQNPFGNMDTQGIFKLILFLVLGYTAIAGLINFIDSFDLFDIRKGTLAGLFMLFSSLATIGICVVIILRMIKNEKYGFLALGFFAISFILGLLNMILIASSSNFIMPFIAGIMGIVITLLAIMPMEKISDPNSYKQLMAEATQIDYILLGVYAVLMIGFLVFFKVMMKSAFRL